MDAIPYTTLRANLAGQMDRVCEDHAPLIVTRKASASGVMISLDDYEAREETSHLLPRPKGPARLPRDVPGARPPWRGVPGARRAVARAWPWAVRTTDAGRPRGAAIAPCRLSH